MPSSTILSENLGKSVINCTCAGCGLNIPHCYMSASLPTGSLQAAAHTGMSLPWAVCVAVKDSALPAQGWGEDMAHPMDMKTQKNGIEVPGLG